MELIVDILWPVTGHRSTSANLAGGKDNPASFAVVRACALHGYAAGSASSVGSLEDICVFGVVCPFVARLTLCNGGATSTP